MNRGVQGGKYQHLLRLSEHAKGADLLNKTL